VHTVVGHVDELVQAVGCERGLESRVGTFDRTLPEGVEHSRGVPGRRDELRVVGSSDPGPFHGDPIGTP
jgi:hypothetical protein